MSKKRILIIDDDPRNIFALAANLRVKGFECLSCTGAREAIRLLRDEEAVDAVLMDMMMPEIDGYEAIPAIKQLPGRAKLPIVAVTAQAMQGDREKCLNAGADGYISKPVDLDKLMELLEQLSVK